MSVKLQTLHLVNFKCFEDHIINYKDTTIIVGENNAGKSTIVEALRILGLACARLESNFLYALKPDWLDEKATLKGVKVTSKDIDVELSHVFSRYGNPPAIIEASFTDYILVKVFINSETELFAILYHDGVNVASNGRAKQIGLPDICVLPQIVPLVENEQFVTFETTRKNRFSRRTSRNFRTILYDNKDTDIYKSFCNLVEETWNKIQIKSIYREESTLYLFLRDRDFGTEVYYMGHGIQMWLQTMWFISNTTKDSIVVLDEPDVYMHADLQRKLIRLLKGRNRQLIIATHSIEIMSEVLPGEILIVDRKRSESIFADSYIELQTLINRLGSVHNINITKLLANKKYLYVEGDDFSILKILYDKIYPESQYSLDYITHTSTGGWGSWQLQLNNVQQFKADMPKLKAYFIYDRDYFTEATIKAREEEAAKHNVYLHIWKKKELENYLILPSAITRFIIKKRSDLSYLEVEAEVVKEVDRLCEDMKQDTWDCILDILTKERENQRKELSTIRKHYQPKFEEEWQDRSRRLSIVGGKQLFISLSDRMKSCMNVSFSDKQIASEFTCDEIPQEIKDVFNAFGIK